MKTKLLIPALIASLFSFVWVSQAQNPTLYNSDDKDASSPCEAVTQKVDDLNKTFMMNRADHLDTYRFFGLRLSTLLYKAELSGYNTTTARYQLAELDRLIKAFESSSAVFSQKLAGIKNAACAYYYSKDNYDYALTSAVSSLREVNKNSISVSEYYFEVMKDSLLSMERLEK